MSTKDIEYACTHSSHWFLVARMAKKPEVFFAIRANGNQLRFKAAMASSQEFRFSVYCVFICLLCTYMMFLHLILHLIVKHLTVFNVSMRLNRAFSMFAIVCTTSGFMYSGTEK